MTEKCEWLHNLLDDLPLITYPFDIEKLPNNGVYFFYEKGELYGHNSKDKPRIVRVGTHREGNFRSRIKDHFVPNRAKMNFDETKSPPRDRSVFRRNLGLAILNKENNKYQEIWKVDFHKPENRKKYSHSRDIFLEREIEKKVSELLQENFSFRYLVIDDQVERLVMESKLIGTLANGYPPSKNWLGNHSPKPKIKGSGLWQSQQLKHSPISESDKKELLKFQKLTRQWLKGTK